uniref:UMP-CMP kinase 2, mitochondrial n=1 Tax=Tetraodon nigroviridis TaxID=99883 RepID=H3DIU9_TETNG
CSHRLRQVKVHADLKEKLLTALPPGCDVAPMCAFFPGVRGSLIKGYFLKDRSEDPSSSDQVLRDLARRDPVLVCSYVRCEDGGTWTQNLWPDAHSETIKKFYVAQSEAPEVHPSALNIINSDVFYSLEEAREVLKESSDIIPEAASVLEYLPSRVEPRGRADFPVIVIEGLDATGKTTLTESLVGALGATLLRSPPQCLSPFRARFDQEPPLIRRAFYALGNYITADQAIREAGKAPVIIDRFWHSTAAYAIATALRGPVHNLPAEGSEVYRWPGDLFQPHLVVLLTLDPEERRRRLKDRGLIKTKEEEKLEHSLFRLKVEEAYRRIIGPACVTVDASPSADQVLQQVQLLIKAKCH